MRRIGDAEAERLVKAAFKARESSYSPYSHFCVGAALLASDGKIYTGCNIENSSYGASNCAERTAFFKAVSDGEKGFEAIAVVGGRTGEEECGECPPCGICRQVMREFCDDDFCVILAFGKKEDPHFRVYTLAELLPHEFSL